MATLAGVPVESVPLSSPLRANMKSGKPRSRAVQGVSAAARKKRPRPLKIMDERATREMILGAALKAFGAHGFSGGSIANVARLHGVSPALIHYYFKNKEELWRAALDYGMGNVIRDLTDTMGDLAEVDSVSRLKFIIRRYIAIVSERPEVFSVIVRESETPGPRLTWLAHEHLNPLYSLWTNLVEAAQAEGKIKAIVPPYHLSQIIVGASYQFLASRTRMLEAYGIDVTTKELRDRHTNAVIEVLFTGLLTSP